MNELEIAGELAEELLKVIGKYNGKISTVAAIGALEIIKINLTNDALENN